MGSNESQDPFADTASFEIFDIPNSRAVHDKAFPLGVKTAEGAIFRDVDAAIKHLEPLIDEGIFNTLLTQRSSQSLNACIDIADE